MLRRRTLLAAAALAPLARTISPAVAQALAQDAAPTDPAALNRPPMVDTSAAREVAPGVTVIPDPRINLVPNIGIVEGSEAVLVVDAGLGPENGRRVLALAQKIAAGRPLILTLTHFHPEHGYGAQAFQGQARLIYNASQAEELGRKGSDYLALFRTFGPAVAEALEGTRIVKPDETYAGERVLDLGGRQVILREMPAHTGGDQIVFLPEGGILFTGDLAETRFFPIFPDDASHGGRWIEVLWAIEDLKPQVVVPGHGAAGGIEILRAVHDYLKDVQNAVRLLAREGLSAAETDRRLTPTIRARYPTWDNPMWIPFAIRVFHSEETGEPLDLPKL